MRLDISGKSIYKLEINGSVLTYYAHPTVSETISIKDITGLECSHNYLKSLPELPDTLMELYCDNNLLQTLPKIPKTLYVLDCSHNLLQTLPVLSHSFLIFKCGNNPLLFVPPLSDRPGNYEVPEELRDIHAYYNYNNYRTRYHTYKFLITFLALESMVLPTILTSDLLLFWK